LGPLLKRPRLPAPGVTPSTRSIGNYSFPVLGRAGERRRPTRRPFWRDVKDAAIHRIRLMSARLEGAAGRRGHGTESGVQGAHDCRCCQNRLFAGQTLNARESRFPMLRRVKGQMAPPPVIAGPTLLPCSAGERPPRHSFLPISFFIFPLHRAPQDRPTPVQASSNPP